MSNLHLLYYVLQEAFIVLELDYDSCEHISSIFVKTSLDRYTCYRKPLSGAGSISRHPHRRFGKDPLDLVRLIIDSVIN